MRSLFSVFHLRQCEALDPDIMQKCFIQWTQSLVGKIQGVVAIDGKTLRGSGEITSDLDDIHMVSAFATENEIILGQLKTEWMPI